MTSRFFATRLVPLLLPACLAALDAPRPNVVVILADDLGIGDLGVYGQQVLQTPQMDRIGNEGLRVAHAYCPASLCAPTRGALFTGHHSGHARVDRNPSNGVELILRPEDETLGELLQGAGYATALVGKWGLGGSDNASKPNLLAAQASSLPTAQGFGEFLGYLNHGHAHNYLTPWLFTQASSGGGVVHFATGLVKISDISYTANIPRNTLDVVTDRAVDVIRRRAGQVAPFYLHCSVTAPHFDLDQVPNAYRARFAGQTGWSDKKKKVAAMVAHLDASVGRILAALDDPDGDGNASDSVAANTLVLLCSDNGPTQEDGGSITFFDSNGPYLGGKRDLYEGGIRTPFLLRWPARVAAGSTWSGQPLNLIDLPPTLAELAGTRAPISSDGVSFAPTLVGTSGQRPRPWQIWEYHEGDGLSTGSNAARWAIRRGDWKLIHFENGTRQLFDLAADPYETSNRAGQQAALVNELAAIAIAEGVERPLGWALDQRSLLTGSATLGSDARWSGSGTPATNWSCRIPAPQTALLDANLSILAASVDAGAMLTVPTGRVLTARNGVRVDGALRLDGGRIAGVRWIEAAGRIAGHGELALPRVEIAGVLEPETGVLALSGELHSSSSAELRLRGASSAPLTLAGAAYLGGTLTVLGEGVLLRAASIERSGLSVVFADGVPADLREELVADGVQLVCGSASAGVPLNQAPSADFSLSAGSGTAPFVLSVDGSASSDPDGSVVTWTWDFGNGQSGNGISASATYAVAGTYTVRLTVVDDLGAAASSQQSISVNAVPQSPAPTPAATAPAVWWRCEEATGTSIADSSGWNRPLILAGDPQRLASPDGQGLLCDGVDDAGQAAWTGVMGGSSRTVSAWVRSSVGGPVLGWGKAVAGQKWTLRLQGSSVSEGAPGALRLEVQDGMVIGTRNLLDGQWHHVAAVLLNDGTPTVSEVQLYIDGVLEPAGFVRERAIATVAGVGVRAGQDPEGRRFTGALDELRIYPRALTAAEILELATPPAPGGQARRPGPLDEAFLVRR